MCSRELRKEANTFRDIDAKLRMEIKCKAKEQIQLVFKRVCLCSEWTDERNVEENDEGKKRRL